MSEKILTALMQLFAIVANREQLTDEAHDIVVQFLRQQVGSDSQHFYLNRFNEFLQGISGKQAQGKEGKRLSVNSVKVLKICTQINSELDQKQKHIVLIRLVEFVNSFGTPAGLQELEFVDTVGSVFNVSASDIDRFKRFCNATSHRDLPNSSNFVLVQNQLPEGAGNQLRFILNESLSGILFFLKSEDENLIFVKYAGPHSLYLNGLPMAGNQSYPFTEGSVIRESRISPVYYSDIARCFMQMDQTDHVDLTVNAVEYRFGNGAVGMHPISFQAQSGNLVGIMGGSGAGKSTLLNILNGNLNPSAGEVLVNGINLHTDRKKLQGTIGYIPQDDLLMEDLTVYQNLYYNSKLSLGTLDEYEINKLIDSLLDTLGLSRIRNLRVGDPVNKMVSGGQRKRLNIAIELIRKPAILFVDEPTSGLSSLDSENVMDLLKQLTLQGNLVFVVIHQPSSDIFRLFDRLLILDTGGYPVYYGNPSDSIIYFNKEAGAAAADLSECSSCGNINPEQIFSIMESKVFDEFGHPTPLRKCSPEEWYQRFLEKKITNTREEKSETIHRLWVKPKWFRQLAVFSGRDVFSKLKNNQYLLINFLQAPLLAFILSYFLKYSPNTDHYTLYNNVNLPVYIFMGIIVALFMGLTVSAEEIIKDRKILKRESFLHLSRGAYIISKILILFSISAIQTLSFVLIGNYVFEISGMFTDYWLMLFTVSCFGNVLGLNISSAFNSAITIYILIPFLVIPQIILSGVMVRFEHMHPSISNRASVPLIGDLMASRWAFEALAVNQYSNNHYEQQFFELDKNMSEAVYRKDFWLVKMNDKLDSLRNGIAEVNTGKLLINEFETIAKNNIIETNLVFSGFDSHFSEDSYKKFRELLESLKKYYINQYKELSLKKNNIIRKLEKEYGNQYLSNLKNHHTNEALIDLVTTTADFDFIVEKDNRFIRRFRPVMMNGDDHSFIRGPFYISGKRFFGKLINTYLANLMVIWFMTLVMIITLYHNTLLRIFRGLDLMKKTYSGSR